MGAPRKFEVLRVTRGVVDRFNYTSNS